MIATVMCDSVSDIIKYYIIEDKGIPLTALYFNS